MDSFVYANVVCWELLQGEVVEEPVGIGRGVGVGGVDGWALNQLDREMYEKGDSSYISLSTRKNRRH